MATLLFNVLSFPSSFALVLGLKNPGSDSWRLCWGNVIDLCWSIPKHVSPSFVCFLYMGLFAYLLCVYMFILAMCLHCSFYSILFASMFIAFNISIAACTGTLLCAGIGGLG